MKLLAISTLATMLLSANVSAEPVRKARHHLEQGSLAHRLVTVAKAGLGQAGVRWVFPVSKDNPELNQLRQQLLGGLVRAMRKPEDFRVKIGWGVLFKHTKLKLDVTETVDPSVPMAEGRDGRRLQFTVLKPTKTDKLFVEQFTNDTFVSPEIRVYQQVARTEKRVIPTDQVAGRIRAATVETVK